MVNFNFPKVAKWLLTLSCSKLVKWPVWKSISSYGGARYNHVTNFFISTYMGVTVIKVGQWKQLFDRSL